LPEHQALARREGRHHVDRLLGTFLLVGAAQRLAIDRDSLGRRPRYRRDPRHEAPLEHCGIEYRENIAEVIVRRRAMGEGPEAAQQIDLLFAEPRNINEGFRSGQHGEQAQQQNLIKRVKHLAGLAWVLQSSEMTQKYHRLAKRPLRSSNPLHHDPPQTNQEDHD
jgi:hypothetical protein